MKEQNINNNEESQNLFEYYSFIVDAKQSTIRIDKFLFDRMPNVTRNKLQDAIKNEYIKVNEKKIKSSYKVKSQDKITVSLQNPPRNKDVEPENIALNIIFEDKDILIINKKAGMVVHPAHQNWSGTLVNALMYHFKNLPEMKNNKGRPGLVHRIDKETSGLLVIAKTEVAMNKLSKQFYDHSIERKYQALIWGTPLKEKDTIRVNLGRSFKDRRIIEGFADNTFGKKAITHYKVIEEYHYISLIECKLETGRTHQIRAHMKHIGHPIFNDKTYGGDQVVKGNRFTNYKKFVENNFKLMPRQGLHAKSLGFIHPTSNKKIFFDSELPEDFKEVINRWKKYNKFVKN
jgi:23S rRNA pseudouridine1911/1915/1917 synthase|tara:strand:+ start:161 stop:1198 length:1038 start_codon:yes stop_codon:yes gene_type:complete